MDQLVGNLDFLTYSLSALRFRTIGERVTTGPVPSFFLYGEPPRAVRERFVHLEKLDDRSRASDWNIRPHDHTELNHVFYIDNGGGTMRADATSVRFAAPCLLLVPSRVVHGFVFDAETTGFVLTAAEGYLRDLIGREPDFRPLLDAFSVVQLQAVDRVEYALRQLSRELAWMAPAHTAAVDALLISLLVEAIRTVGGPQHELARAAHGASARLVAHFRELVEERYRTDATMDAYALALAVTSKQLRSACRRVAHRSPLQIVQDRLLLESKRLMLYSNMTVAEAGYSLGFPDPAYFARFFKQRAGVYPRQFRTGVRAVGPDAQGHTDGAEAAGAVAPLGISPNYAVQRKARPQTSRA